MTGATGDDTVRGEPHTNHYGALPTPSARRSATLEVPIVSEESGSCFSESAVVGGMALGAVQAQYPADGVPPSTADGFEGEGGGWPKGAHTREGT